MTGPVVTDYRPDLRRDVVKPAVTDFLSWTCVFAFLLLLKGTPKDLSRLTLAPLLALLLSVLIRMVLLFTWRIVVEPGRMVVFHRLMWPSRSFPADDLLSVKRVFHPNTGWMLKVTHTSGSFCVLDCETYRLWARRMHELVPEIALDIEPKPKAKAKRWLSWRLVLGIAGGGVGIAVLGFLCLIPYAVFYWVRGGCCEYWTFAGNLVFWSAVSGGIAALFWWMIGGTFEGREWTLQTGLIRSAMLALGVMVIAGFLFPCLNAWLDRSPAVRHDVALESMLVNRSGKGRVRSVWLRFRDWRNPEQLLWIPGSGGYFRTASVGKRITILTGEGYLGHEWVRGIIAEEPKVKDIENRKSPRR